MELKIWAFISELTVTINVKSFLKSPEVLLRKCSTSGLLKAKKIQIGLVRFEKNKIF